MGGWYDETNGALATARHIGSVHEEVIITSHDLQRTMDDLIYSLDEPRMGPGSFSQYMVAKEAAQKVKVILTGHGGDELFAGYPVFKAILLSQTLRNNVLNAAQNGYGHQARGVAPRGLLQICNIPRTEPPDTSCRSFSATTR